MKNKTKTVLKVEKELIVKREDGSTMAILAEGVETYILFDIKGKEQWFYGIITQLCPKTMFVRNIESDRIHRFNYERLMEVSDKCPM